MTKKAMTKERYLELKQIAKSILTKLGNETNLDEVTCKSIIKKIKFLENEEEEMIIINSLMFPSDEEFLEKLKSLNNNINAVANYYHCSGRLIMGKKAEIDIYYRYLTDFSDSDKVDEGLIKSDNQEKTPENDNEENIYFLKLKVFEYEKLLEAYEKTAKDSKERICTLEEENEVLKKAIVEVQNYFKDALESLNNMNNGRK
ncbi:MAG: hypothetical protein RR290_04645 [Clostridia bacterium]